jgi:hypothetical protein
MERVSAGSSWLLVLLSIYIANGTTNRCTRNNGCHPLVPRPHTPDKPDTGGAHHLEGSPTDTFRCLGTNVYMLNSYPADSLKARPASLSLQNNDGCALRHAQQSAALLFSWCPVCISKKLVVVGGCCWTTPQQPDGGTTWLAPDVDHRWLNILCLHQYSKSRLHTFGKFNPKKVYCLTVVLVVR